MNRKTDLETVIKQLDITPTMYMNAVSKYRAISEFLESKDIKADFYPQGSFRLGTVIRPIKNGRDADYDLDVICELTRKKTSTNPFATKNSVGDALKSDKTYSQRLLPEDNRCWTLQYALVDGETGFSLDIVPSVHQDEKTINNLMQQGVSQAYSNGAIAITERVTKSEYIWKSSNPKGYGEWFDSFNERFLAGSRVSLRTEIFNENRSLFASIEDVPSALERSPLQRVIQILKRHRDIFYINAKKWDKRPISAIISTLAAKISLHANPETSIIDLVTLVSNDLSQYALLLEGKHPGYYSNFEERSYIKKENQKWRISNPVDPSDNYTDSWDDETARLFFKWVQAIKLDFVDTIEKDDVEYFTGLKNGFGTAIVEKAIPNSKKQMKPVILTGTKPWRESY